MKLYVMRHGPAEDDSASGADGDRALTPAGRDRTRAVAKKLAEADEAPLVVFTSPLVRCVQTAEVVAVLTKLTGPVHARRELAPGGFTHKLVEHVVATGQRRAMLCGHEPDLSALVGQLLGSPPPFGMQKAMVVGLQGGDEGKPGWRLRFVLDPKSLAWEHDSR
jgi:phosphohistidine phosphatase